MRSRLLGLLVACVLPLVACGPAGTAATPVPAPRSPSNASTASRVAPPIPPSPQPSPALPRRAEPAPRPAQQDLGEPTVVLDPGHNGANAAHPAAINRPVPNGRGGTKPCNTTGAQTDEGYPEAAFNWDVALRVRDELRARGVRVVLTRPDNDGVGPCVDQRAAMATREGAAALVSIHADGAAASGHGFHVAYSDPPLNPSQGAPSIGLARALADAMRAGGFSAAGYIGARGLDPRSDLAGLNLARVPAALVECANMRNPQEAALISTPAGRARYAAALSAGIVAWLAAHGLVSPG